MMNTYRVKGVLRPRPVLRGRCAPLLIGGNGDDNGYVNRAIGRDVDGTPLLPGTTVAGQLASLARMSLRARGWDPLRHPAYIALFGTARDEGNGQSSRLRTWDLRAKLAPAAPRRDRNAISRRRGSAEEKHLFRDEVVDGPWAFPFDFEFAETGPSSPAEMRLASAGGDPNGAAWCLLRDALELLGAGWGTLGASASIGYGRVVLEDLKVQQWNRRDPDAVLRYARHRWDGFEDQPLRVGGEWDTPAGRAADASAVTLADRAVERLRFVLDLEPVEPLLVKSGLADDEVQPVGASFAAGLGLSWKPVPLTWAVDGTFVVDAAGDPYVPGGSVRGVLRTRAERVIRTLTGNADSAWDVPTARERGKHWGEQPGGFEESELPCLVSPVFGFTALGGRLLVSDAVPLSPARFRSRLKLLDHVAIDRFTGGAANQLKFNERPFVPPHPCADEASREDTHLRCELELFDFELWHLGLVLLLLRDMRLGRILVGHGRNKGYGRVRPVCGVAHALVGTGPTILGSAAPESAACVGGFRRITDSALNYDSDGYAHAADDKLDAIFRSAVDECRAWIAAWQPPAGRRRVQQ